MKGVSNKNKGFRIWYMKSGKLTYVFHVDVDDISAIKWAEKLPGFQELISIQEA